MKRLISLVLVFSIFMLSGCAVTPHKGLFGAGGEELKLRQMQTRYFDTTDKKKTMECVMATLQDYGFIIDRASYELGTLSATKLQGYRLIVTVSIMPRGDSQMTVRANAQYNVKPVQEPEAYQQFFDALSKSMFLQAHLEE